MGFQYPAKPLPGQRVTTPSGITFQWATPPGGWVNVGAWDWPPTPLPHGYAEFPPNPDVGDEYTTPSGIVFVFSDKNAWRVLGESILASPYFLAGVGRPPDITGYEGNYYLDVSTGELWGPYTAGAWPYPPSPFAPPQGYEGPPGPQGIQGDQGIQGPAGPAGPTGPEGADGPQGSIGPVGPQGTPGAPGPPIRYADVFGSFVNHSPSQLPTNGFIPANWDAPGVPSVDTTIPINGAIVYAANQHLWQYVGTAFNPAGWIDLGSAQGPTGLQGVQGQMGPMGPSGPQGPSGAVGPAGGQGLQGTQGPAGGEGPTGQAGVQGPMGAMGPQGIQGDPGPQGVEGPVGPPGSTVVVVGNFTADPSTLPADGLIPADWESPGVPQFNYQMQIGQGLYYEANGDVYLYVGTTVTPGGWVNLGIMQGPQGVQGPQGIAGPIGTQGPVGPAGQQGIQGNPGPAGAQGPQGDIGPIGATGPVGQTGNTGPMGPQGPAGNPGSTGPAGVPGPAGPAGDTGAIFGYFSVQSPSSLPTNGYIPVNWDAPGNPANAVQMQLGQALVDSTGGHLWTFVTTTNSPTGWIDGGKIVGPAGPTGPTGATGAVGPIGPTGPQGPQGIIQEAPAGGPFARQTGAWVTIPPSGISDAPAGGPYARQTGAWVNLPPSPIATDAPNDGQTYGRQNLAWHVITVPPATTIGSSPPASPQVGQLWWDNVGCQLYVFYNDGSSSQWVIANSTLSSSGVTNLDMGTF